MKLPIGVLMDPHLHEWRAYAHERDGHNSRLLVCRDAVLRACELTRKAGGRTLLIGGDWFHSRQNVSTEVLHVTAETLRKAKKAFGVRIMLTPGNHDMSPDGKFTSVLGVRFARVISKPSIVEIDGWKIGFIPWTDDPLVVQRITKREADFFVAHVGVAGSKVGPSDMEIPGHIGIGDFLTKKPVLLGHYHKPQQVSKNIWYVGSPVQHTWGETNEDKGFYIVDPKKGPVWKPLPEFPRFVRVQSKDELKNVRKIDYVEIVLPEGEQTSFVEGRKNVIVKKTKRKTESVRRALSGTTAAEHIDEWLEQAQIPKGLTKKGLRRLGLEFLNG